MKILYEDNHLLVVEKPPGLLAQRDRSGDADLLTQLKGYIKEKYHKPGDVYLGLVHRLDRNAGGVMVFARTSKAASRLSEQIRTRTVGKGYLAVVRGCPPEPEGTLDHFLHKNSDSNLTAVVGQKTSGAQRAVLHYQVLETSSTGWSLVVIRLETGRPHQIRVQMAAVGCPLWGDRKYGGKAAGRDRFLGLWAYRLSLVHPIRGDTMDFRAWPPRSGPWESFSRLEELPDLLQAWDTVERSTSHVSKDQP